MKNLLVLLSIIVLASCSPDNGGCDCEKRTYESITTVTFGGGGSPIPIWTTTETTLSNESVLCQEETSGSLGNDIYFEITCN